MVQHYSFSVIQQFQLYLFYYLQKNCLLKYLSKTETNATLNVTDEEYRSLGFEVTDMVCCKVSVFPQLQVLEFQCVEVISRASVGAFLILSIGTGPLL